MHLRWNLLTGWGAIIIGSLYSALSALGPLALILVVPRLHDTPAHFIRAHGYNLTMYIARVMLAVGVGIAGLLCGIAFLRRMWWSRRALQVVAALLGLTYLLGLTSAVVASWNHPPQGVTAVLFVFSGVFAILVCACAIIFIRFLGQPKVREYVRKPLRQAA